MLLLVTLIVSIPYVVSNLGALINGGVEIPIHLGIGITILAELLVIAGAVALAGLWPMTKLMFLKLHSWKHLLLGLGAGLASYVVLQGIAIAAGALFGEPLKSSDTSQQLTQLGGIGGALFLILVVGILAPTLEELLFRGVILGALQHSSWNKAWIAIAVSAVTFGAMHFQGFGSFTDIAVLIWITIMGGFFAWLVIKTQSLWTAVAAHIAYNMVTSIVILGMGS